ncbi:MAG: putative cobaltochelatase [Deltaproteobacteria bacterium]|nr:putative cobaltochelatase [Deltaproteobacteria bacterium]
MTWGWERWPVYPFSAIVGQDQMKKALLLNAVCPSIGGLLIRGDKGTAKSTAVRALASLLPEIEVVDDCPFGCNPRGPLCLLCRERVQKGHKLLVTRRKIRVVDLPLGATEDRVTGTIDLEQAVKEGTKALQPGLLASAHRGILYIDEVNLLHDHIVDIILDASAMGVNIVEREGISLSHPSEFILVGTMNPEEGELRPQLLDRFGLCVEMGTPWQVEPRLQVLKRREQFDENPWSFLEACGPQQEDLAKTIIEARKRILQISVSEEMIRLCSQLSQEAFVAGHRADITMRKTARAIAALGGRVDVREEDVHEAAELVLLHRMRKPPPPPPPPEHQHEHDHIHDHEDEPEKDHSEQDEPQGSPPPSSEKGTSEQDEAEQPDRDEKDSQDNRSSIRPGIEMVFPVGSPFQVRNLPMKTDRLLRKGSGRRTRSRTMLKTGRYVRSRQDENSTDLALDATLRAAAPYQTRRKKVGVAVAIEKSDLRKKVREKRIGNLIVFVVDASGSMGAGKRMIETKGAVLSLLLDAYQKRDKVAMVAFRGKDADVLLPPTNSVELTYKLLEELPTGGRTPLAHGLALGYQIVDSQLRKDPYTYPILVLISDGKGNVSLSGGKALPEAVELAKNIGEDGRISTVVIDVEKPGLISFGLAHAIASSLGGLYFKIEDLKAETLVDVLKQEVLI